MNLEVVKDYYGNPRDTSPRPSSVFVYDEVLLKDALAESSARRARRGSRPCARSYGQKTRDRG
jgi:hypothetical protein